MSRTFLTGCAALAVAALLTQPAGAQTISGTVNVSGFVQAQCGTVVGSSVFSGSIGLGQLAQSNGTLLTTLTQSNSGAPAGTTALELGCSTVNSTVTLSATELTTSTAIPSNSFSNTIDYTAEVEITMAAGGFTHVTYTTAQAAPAPTVQTVVGQFAAVPENFEIKVYGLNAVNGASSILVAGTYTGVITIGVATAA